MVKKFTLTTIAILLALLLLESAARLLESGLSKPAAAIQKPGWQAEFFSSFLGWHESEPELLWRFRANLDNPLIKTNSDHLLGGELPAKKDVTVFRMLLLGDSSPVGLGLKSRRQAFGEVLRYLLELEYLGNRQIELVNASVSGYTSEQIVRFLELRGWSYMPDLVILYCGNNDGSVSGSSSDYELLAGQELKFVRKTLSRLALYRTLRNMLAVRAEHRQELPRTLKLRVAQERFKENVARIASQCRERDCPLIIVKPAVPYLWPAGLQCKLFTHMTGAEGQLIFPDEMAKTLGREIKYCLSRERFAELYGKGDIFTKSVYESAYDDSMNPEEAIEYYSGLLSSNPDDPVVLNNLGVSYWENKQNRMADRHLKLARKTYMHRMSALLDYNVTSAGSPFLYNVGINLLSRDKASAYAPDTTSEGFIYLDSALQADFFSLRIKRSHAEILDSFSGREGIYIVDLPEIFKRNGGEKLFIDHCHPTAEGHRLIATELARVINNYSIIQ